MNKYEKCYKKYENTNYNKWYFINLKCKLKIYKYFCKIYGKEQTNIYFSKTKRGVLFDVIFELDSFKEDVQEFVRKEIIPNINTNLLMQIFIQNLTDAKTRDDQKYIDECMKSFKSTGLIKDIKIDNDLFEIRTLDDHVFKVKNILSSEEEIKENTGECHNISQYIISGKDAKEWECITILEPDLVYSTRYHSFLIRNGVVHDFARNIAMLYSEYERIFNYKVLSRVRGDILKDKIKELSILDEDFNKSKKNKVLKYAMHKQMNN